VQYARQGWRVFPLRPRGKQPVIDGGFHKATADQATVEAWWTRWPGANIACAPGPSGFVVIDVDGVEGEALAQSLGLLAEPTLEVATGRNGGRHRWYRHPGGHIGNTGLGKGLDVRADAGYAILPPSIHPSGQTYRWLGKLEEVATLPPVIVARLQAAKANGASTGTPARDIPLLEAIPEGQRNASLTSFAGRHLARGDTEAEILELTLALNQAKCRPPLPPNEVRQIVRSIAAREAEKEGKGRATKSRAPSPEGNGGTPRAITRRLSDVQSESVSWLSPGRIPFGKLTVLEGDPGLGKSTVLLDLAARLTRGQGFPGDPALEPAHVILLTAEDGLADTVRPRLEAAGADCNRVHTLEGFIRDDGATGEIVLGDPNNPASLVVLEELIRATGAGLVIVDVLTAFLSGARDSYRDHDMRGALRPLASLAERTGCAIVVVRHLRKSGGGKAITAGGGSIAIGGAARSVLLVDKDPEDDERRVVASVKCNLAPPPPSLAFRIEGTETGVSRIVWLGQSEHTAESLTEARASEAGEVGQRSKVEECADCLLDWLASGAMDRKEVLRLGRDRGFSDSTVERAARKIGVVAHRSGFGKEARSMWSLPSYPSGEPISVNSRHMGNADGHGRADGYEGGGGVSEEAIKRATEQGDAWEPAAEVAR
jgi:hypothetical protein